MRRAVDLRCESCEAVRYGEVCEEDARPTCHVCNMYMEQCWWGLQKSAAHAQWQVPTVVHISNDPSVPADVRVRYPARIDAPLPAGYERVEIRSDREMGKFEREHKVLHHQRHYDRNGGGFDTTWRGQREGWNH